MLAVAVFAVALGKKRFLDRVHLMVEMHLPEFRIILREIDVKDIILGRRRQGAGERFVLDLIQVADAVPVRVEILDLLEIDLGVSESKSVAVEKILLGRHVAGDAVLDLRVSDKWIPSQHGRLQARRRDRGIARRKRPPPHTRPNAIDATNTQILRALIIALSSLEITSCLKESR